MNRAASTEHDAFREFEHSGWKAVAGDYHDHFAPLTRQAVPALLDAAGTGKGARLLDVCTGPGYAAAAAAERGASVVGLDFAPPMVARARRESPAARFVVGDAEQLPFDSASLDGVITNFGVLHLSHPERFLREAYRVLRASRRVAFTVWADPREAVSFAIVLDAIQAHGNPTVPLPEGPPFFRFSDPHECRTALEEAGFSEPNVAQVPLLWKLEGADLLFQAMLNGTVRTGGLLRAQTPAALAAIRSAIRGGVEAYRRGNSYELPMSAILAGAVKK